MAKIADISKWQGNIDWNQASKELDFCIIRSSNNQTEDSMFSKNAVACQENKIPFHVYHYLKAGSVDQAIVEAQFFYKVASPYSPLFYVVDVEDAAIPVSQAREIVNEFIDELKRLGVERTGIYVAHNRYSQYNLDINNTDYVWIPRYGANDGTITGAKQPSYPCDLWQFTSTGSVNGISGNVDLNVLNGDKPLSFFIEEIRDDIAIEEKKSMTYDPKKVIEVALAEVGYLEKETNSQLDDKTANAGDNNYTKYARDLNALNFYNGNKQGVAWCDMFVDWCMVQAYGKDVALAITFQPIDNTRNYGAGCKYSRQYYEQNGMLFYTPEIGDQIFFYNSSKSTISHTGLVYDVDGTYVYTVEGNTSGASGVIANGGGVCKKKYALNYNRLAGYGRPNYGMKYEVGFKPLSKGDKGAAVKELQQNLMKLGFDLSTYSDDGDYGNETKNAVVNFQKKYGITPTGVYNEETHNKMDELLSDTFNTKQEEVSVLPSESIETPTVTAPISGSVVTNSGTWNLRNGPGTGYAIAGVVNGGFTLEVVDSNDWIPVKYSDKVLWLGPSAVKK